MMTFRATRRQFVFQATGTEMAAGTFTKDPIERYPVGINMAGQVHTGAELYNATVAAIDTVDGAIMTATVLVTPMAKISGMIVEVEVRGGVHQHRYTLAFTVRDQANHVYLETLTMFVRNTP